MKLRTIQDPIKRFFSRVDKSQGPLGCWLFDSDGGDGYGKFTIRRRKNIRANRYSYELMYGTISENLQILHKCDVRACVNPLHLYAGTAKQNTQDRKSRGFLYASHNKLNQNDADKIRKMRFEENFPVKEIASKYNVTIQTIYYILKNKTWVLPNIICLNMKKEK